ncbi:MAG: peptidase M23, partial [Alloalcanivorax venustensis]
MSIKLSALGRAARRFPRTHLILSGALVITVGLIALTPESGESRPERLQTLDLPKKPSASQELTR